MLEFCLELSYKYLATNCPRWSNKIESSHQHFSGGVLNYSNFESNITILRFNLILNKMIANILHIYCEISVFINPMFFNSPLKDK